MTLVIDEKDQLAAPDRLETVSPPLFDFTQADEATGRSSAPVVDLVPDSLEGFEPSFLVQARELAKVNEGSAMAQARLAQAAMAAGEHHLAVEAAREALKQARLTERPDEPAVFSAARTLMACGELEEAERTLCGLSPTGPSLVLAATLAARRGDLDGAFKRLGDDQSVDAWDLRGWIALREGYFDQAIRLYRRAAQAGGPSPVVLANLGLAHAALGSQERAISETRQALALRPAERRRIALNLVAYLVANGHADEAMQELRALQDDFPDDIELVFAEAHWRLAIGDPERAERRLRKARETLLGSATEVQQAELVANLAYLRWYCGTQSRADVANEVLRRLRGVGWKSHRLGAMIPVLLCRYSEKDRLNETGRAIAAANPGTRLYSIDVQRAVLEDRIAKATQLAVEWADNAIFAPEAAMTATFMLIDVEDRFDDAVKLGSDAIKRMPAVSGLINNVAYALVLAGQADRAHHLLRPVREDALHLRATRGLIAAWRGDVEAGLRMYDEAEAQAVDEDLPDSAKFVAINRRLVGTIPHDTSGYEIDKPIVLPKGWDDNPYYVWRLRMLRRRGASLEDISVEEGGPFSPDDLPVADG
jgi:tetratricopeptide (TPR) repeat protein